MGATADTPVPDPVWTVYSWPLVGVAAMELENIVGHVVMMKCWGIVGPIVLGVWRNSVTFWLYIDL